MVPCSPPRAVGSLNAFNLSAVAGLVMIALSQQILVIGFGSSCSQPLFAKRPSQTEGSGRNDTSTPDAAWFAGGAFTADACSETVLGANAVFGMTPSFSHRRQLRSKSAGDPAGCAVPQNSRTMSYGVRSGRSLKAAMTSCAVRPL